MICSHLDTIENDWETAVLGIKSSKYNDMLGMVSYELPKVVKRNAEIARILSKVRWKNNNTDAIAKEMKLLSEVRMHQKDMIVQKFWGKVPLLSSDYDQICGYIGQRTSALAVLLRGMPIKEE